MIDGLVHDLRLAWRGLRRAPGFSLAVVLIFSLGMAGASSMFALVEGVLLRPLAVPQEGQLVVGWRQLPNSSARHWPFHAADDRDDRGQQPHAWPASRASATTSRRRWRSSSPARPRSRRSQRVTGGFFQVLGVAPALGRVLEAADDVAGSEPVLVITHALWQRLGGSREVLGRRVRIAGQAFTIVGVMPPDVEHPRGVEAWVTVAALQTIASNETFREALREELEFVATAARGHHDRAGLGGAAGDGAGARGAAR